MFTCQLFNALHRIDAGASCSSLLLNLVSKYPEFINDDIKQELGFLMDTSFSKDFDLVKDNKPLLTIKRDGYELLIHDWDWSSRNVNITLNGYDYLATYEKYKDLVAIICESEVVSIFNAKLII